MLEIFNEFHNSSVFTFSELLRLSIPNVFCIFYIKKEVNNMSLPCGFYYQCRQATVFHLKLITLASVKI